PIVLAGDEMRLAPSYYDKIQLSEPFCWIWPNLSDSIGLAKFNALVRYALMARGYPGYLSDMSFPIQQVFPQLCSDIAQGQDVKKMKSVWKDGMAARPDLRGGDGDDGCETEDGHNEEPLPPTFAVAEASEQEQKRSVKERMQYLTEEFEAFQATLRADFEDQEATKNEQEDLMQGLTAKIESEQRRVHALGVELEDAQNETMMWKRKYETLNQIMFELWRK
ncbi:hypothetical protein EK21DRAFT_44499, partial [Setomelanomma holmii]